MNWYTQRMDEILRSGSGPVLVPILDRVGDAIREKSRKRVDAIRFASRLRGRGWPVAVVSVSDPAVLVSRPRETRVVN